MKKYPNEINEHSDNLYKKRNVHSFISSIKVPDISHININSHFVYDEVSAINHFNKITNKNILKPTDKEVLLLHQISDEIKNEKIYSNNKENLITIKYEYYEKLCDINPKIKNESSEIINFIRNILENSKNREGLSCRKLAELYGKTFKKKIGKSTIHNILRKKLNYRYLKTCFKNRRIESDVNKMHCFFFIKSFIKCAKLGFQFIFLDESKLEIKNNHYRAWRKKEEQLVFGENPGIKKNLFLAIGAKDIVLYQFSDENMTAKSFIDILVNLKMKIQEKYNKNFILVLDNCSSHKTEEVIKYMYDNNINALFTPPYQSTFTPIELAFRAIKRILYSRIYNRIEEAIKDTEIIISDQNFKKTLLLNYAETINQYISYLDINGGLNLNTFKI